MTAPPQPPIIPTPFAHFSNKTIASLAQDHRRRLDDLAADAGVRLRALVDANDPAERVAHLRALIAHGAEQQHFADAARAIELETTLRRLAVAAGVPDDTADPIDPPDSLDNIPTADLVDDFIAGTPAPALRDELVRREFER